MLSLLTEMFQILQKQYTVKLGYNALGYNELGYNEFGYNEQIIMVYWFGSIFFRLFLSWLLQTTVIMNRFGRPQ